MVISLHESSEGSGGRGGGGGQWRRRGAYRTMRSIMHLIPVLDDPPFNRHIFYTRQSRHRQYIIKEESKQKKKEKHRLKTRLFVYIRQSFPLQMCGGMIVYPSLVFKS